MEYMIKIYKEAHNTTTHTDHPFPSVLDEAHLKVAVRAMARLHALSLVHLAK